MIYDVSSMSHMSHEMWTSTTSYEDVMNFFTVSLLYPHQESPSSVNLVQQDCVRFWR